MALKHSTAISAIVISAVVIVSVVVIIIPIQDSLKFIQAKSLSVPANLSGVTLNHDNSLMFATNIRQGISLMILTITNNGSFLGGTTYSITSLSGSNNNYTVKDDGPRDTNKATPGIITVAGLQNGNYTVTEVNSSQGYSIDKVSKIIEIKTGQNAPIATFTNIPLNEQNNNNNSQIKSITYTAKFECGSIIGDEGPLRPGHYDTDISVFNRQEYPVKILLNAIVNDEKGTNAIVKTLQPQTSTAITCKDIHQLFNIGNNSKELVEGFVLIGVHFNNGMLGSVYDNGGSSSTVITPPLSKDEINFLDVQVFYTANALETLPHEILIDKITFSILNDTSKKIPSSLLTKILNIDLQSQMNQISDPESKINSVLAKIYNLSDHEVGGLKIKIIDVSIGVGTMIDDHAISSSTVRPQSST